MCRQVSLIGLAMALTAATAAGQVTTTSPATIGTVPVFTGTAPATIGNSVITQSNGNVGIGTAGPQAILNVHGNYSNSGSGGIMLDSSDNGNPESPDYYLSINPFAIGSGMVGYQFKTVSVTGGTNIPLTFDNAGRIGIGTTSPTAPLTVFQSGLYNSGTQRFIDFSGDFAGTNPSTTSNAGALTAIRIGDTSYAGKYAMIGSVSEDPIGYSRMTGLSFWTSTQDASPLERLRITSGGSVGIGTTSPAAKLDVNGSINISGAGGSITFPNGGGTQSAAWTGVLCGGDYAESVDVAGDRKSYEPGDVLVIGAESGSDVVKSSEPYSTLVLGVYSTKPGVVGRRQNTDPKVSRTEVPMAMVGIVPTKVSAENGPIRRGDLLVTSSTVGYAMKGIDRSKMLGAVIGKALGSLDSGTGVIEVAVTLQ